jgi:hypothetical protein
MKVQYPVERTVSVWIGTFPSETDSDKCVDKKVAPALHLGAPLESICEIAFERQECEPRSLIQGFSGWQTFVEDAVRVAASKGIARANSALVCYYLRCTDAPDNWGDLHFLGSFSGQDVA